VNFGGRIFSKADEPTAKRQRVESATNGVSESSNGAGGAVGINNTEKDVYMMTE
jgi:hypothetical protein